MRSLQLIAVDLLQISYWPFRYTCAHLPIDEADDEGTFAKVQRVLETLCRRLVMKNWVLKGNEKKDLSARNCIGSSVILNSREFAKWIQF